VCVYVCVCGVCVCICVCVCVCVRACVHMRIGGAHGMGDFAAAEHAYHQVLLTHTLPEREIEGETNTLIERERARHTH